MSIILIEIGRKRRKEGNRFTGSEKRAGTVIRTGQPQKARRLIMSEMSKKVLIFGKDT
jgi:hypothetical protein